MKPKSNSEFTVYVHGDRLADKFFNDLVHAEIIGGIRQDLGKTPSELAADGVVTQYSRDVFGVAVKKKRETVDLIMRYYKDQALNIKNGALLMERGTKWN